MADTVPARKPGYEGVFVQQGSGSSSDRGSSRVEAAPQPGYPFSAIVGQDQLRLSLILCAVHPGIGGVLVRGEKGTAKSTVVRALAALLPAGWKRRARPLAVLAALVLLGHALEFAWLVLPAMVGRRSGTLLFATVAAVTGRKLGQAEGEDSFNILPALTGEPGAKVRDHLLIAPLRRTHLSLRKGDWIYIGARGHGGFGAKKVGEHGLGGPAAQLFTGHVNSDIEDGKIKPDAPSAQLYNLAKDPYQKQNVIRFHPKIAEKMKSEMQSIRSTPTTPHTTLGL